LTAGGSSVESAELFPFLIASEGEEKEASMRSQRISMSRVYDVSVRDIPE
jgi:hypothetical protein